MSDINARKRDEAYITLTFSPERAAVMTGVVVAGIAMFINFIWTTELLGFVLSIGMLATIVARSKKIHTQEIFDTEPTSMRDSLMFNFAIPAILVGFGGAFLLFIILATLLVAAGVEATPATPEGMLLGFSTFPLFGILACHAFAQWPRQPGDENERPQSDAEMLGELLDKAGKAKRPAYSAHIMDVGDLATINGQTKRLNRSAKGHLTFTIAHGEARHELETGANVFVNDTAYKVVKVGNGYRLKQTATT